MSDILPDLYVVEKIRDKRVKGGKVEYLVKWENYPETQNTWEPLTNLETVIFLVEEYEEKLKKKKKKNTTSEQASMCK
jgi:hypothetical protein